MNINSTNLEDLVNSALEKQDSFIKNLSNLIRFDDTNISVNIDGGSAVPSRYIILATDSRDKNYYIKMPKLKRYTSYGNRSDCDALAWLVNHFLKFNTVPMTVSLQQHAKTVNKYIYDINIRQQLALFYDKYEYLGSTIQELIESTVDIENNKKVDISSAHKAILLNIILGRNDADIHNSVVTTNGLVYDVDNELIGGVTTGYWLIPKVKHSTISQDIIDQLLSCDIPNLLKVYRLASLSIPDYMNDIITNICDNYCRLVSFVSSVPTVKVSDLMTESFYKLPKLEIECNTQ